MNVNPDMRRVANASQPALRAAFTLVELLVVIAIIGIVAAMSVPAFKNFQKADAEAAATRQLVDEVANARQRAISSRSDVYMVFIPSAQNDYFTSLVTPTSSELQQATNLLRMQLAGYGFYSERNVGDQPGQFHPRYIGEWRRLPAGMFVARDKFFMDTPPVVLASGGTCPGVQSFWPLWYRSFPFPTANSKTFRSLPYIGFDFQGRVFHEDASGQKVYGTDAVIPLARGTVAAEIGGTVDEKPPNNSVNAYTHVVVDWLTGRGSIEREQISGN